MTYQPGEKLQITTTGTVGRVLEAADRTWLELLLDPEGGIAQSVPLDCPAVTINRVTPAAGTPKPGELWQDRDGTELFVTKNQYGYPQFTTADGHAHSITRRNEQFGPLTPIRQLPAQQELAEEPQGGDV